MQLKPRPEIVDRKLNTIFAWLIFFGTLIVYGLTQAKSLSFWDAGEYITCSSILGIPHPPGNPFYILLGKFATIFAGGFNHALIVNFLSGIFSAFAVMFTYLFTVKLVTMFEDSPWYAYFGGFIAAFFMAFSYTFWTNAIEAEVYSGLAFIIHLIIWLTMIYVEKSEDFSHQNILVLIIYIFFLGFGIHQTSLQIAASVMFVVLYPLLIPNVKKGSFWIRSGAYFFGLILIYAIFKSLAESLHIPPLPKIAFATTVGGLLFWHMKDKVKKRTWIMSLFIVVLGLSTHIFLWIRSDLRPFINEGHPNNWAMFMDYILRRQYGVTSFMVRRADFIYQLNEHFFQYFRMQFFNVAENPTFSNIQKYWIEISGLFTVLSLGFLGIYRQIKKNKHSFIYYFSFFFMSSLAMVFIINLSDKEVRPRDYFFTTAYCLWTFWMGVGAISLVDSVRKLNKGLALVFAVVIVGLPAFNLYSQYFIHDRSKELVALDYGLNLLNGLEENAIIFTNGDNDTFPLWYTQAVKDVYAIEHIYPASDVYPTETTKEMLAAAKKYKDKNLKGIRKDVTIANLSLLNTPWYIRQLRDLEGVEFSWSDKLIDQLKPMIIDKETKIQAISPKKEVMTMTIPGDLHGSYTILQNKDTATIELIRSNFGKRPIYFAVTVSDYVFNDKNLKREGMVYRLVADNVSKEPNYQRLKDNIDNVYSFRSILDDSVYKDPNMRRLVGNYANLYQEMALINAKNRNYTDALKNLDFAEKFLMDVEDVYLFQKVDFLMQMGNNKEAEEMISDKLNRDPNNLDFIYRIITFYVEYGNDEKVIELLTHAISLDPQNEKPYVFAYQLAKYKSMEDSIIRLFTSVKEKVPNSHKVMDELIKDLEKSKQMKQKLNEMNN